MSEAQLETMRALWSKGVTTIRRPRWSHPMDHLILNLSGPHEVDGFPLFGKLYCPFGMECSGHDPEHLFLRHSFLPGPDDTEWVEYVGPLAYSPEYLAARESYRGILTPQKESA